MLQAFELSYEHSPLFGPIFQNVSLSLTKGEKVGLVGPNGCGKSTLLALLAGDVPLQVGQLVAPGRSTLLHQDSDFHFDGTALDAIFSRSEEGVLESDIRKTASRLSLAANLLDRPYSSLSLGERMRAALVAVLCADADILLLDEPTNHLDLAGRQWLEDFLIHSRMTILMVCHDRAMLDAVVTRTLELDRGKITEYAGGYSAMIEAKKGNIKRQMAEYETEKEEVRRLKNASERALQRAGKLTQVSSQRTYDPAAKPFYAARQKAADKRAKAIRHRADQIQSRSVEKPFIADGVSFQIPTEPMPDAIALTVRHVSKNYSEPLFENLSLTLEAGERVALLGANGSGKTTLMRIIVGEQDPDSGEVILGRKVKIGYLSQGRQLLSEDLPVVDALVQGNPAVEAQARSLLGKLGLTGDAVHKRVGQLSVGERTKAELVRILLTGANLLILDEPTNHLDIDSLEALEQALLAFPGSVLFTSHDRAFVSRVANRELTLTKC